jgi:glycosyltransferase involved in cell wall biosynthesis
MITCVMVTGAPRMFPNMPDVAVQCFLAQTYEDCELLILNHGTKDFFGKNVRDVKVRKDDGTYVGVLRNLAFYLANGDYLLTWDDDDWHDPNRVAYQAAYAKPNTVSVLKNKIHVNLLTGEAGIKKTLEGGMSTMLYPRRTSTRFPNYKTNSDLNFYTQFDGAIITLGNSPEWYVRNYHGKNLSREKDMMADLLPLNDKEKTLVSQVRSLYEKTVP